MTRIEKNVILKYKTTFLDPTKYFFNIPPLLVWQKLALICSVFKPKVSDLQSLDVNCNLNLATLCPPPTDRPQRPLDGLHPHFFLFMWGRGEDGSWISNRQLMTWNIQLFFVAENEAERVIKTSQWPRLSGRQ